MVESRSWRCVGKAVMSYSLKSVIFRLDSRFIGESFVVFSEDLLELIAGHMKEVGLYARMVSK